MSVCDLLTQISMSASRAAAIAMPSATTRRAPSPVSAGLVSTATASAAHLDPVGVSTTGVLVWRSYDALNQCDVTFYLRWVLKENQGYYTVKYN